MPGENHKFVSRDEGRSLPTEDWLATTIEVLELAAANPAVAPHSCSHCREWELDLNHKNLRHVTPPSDGQAQSGFTTSYAREKAELGCAFFKRIVRTDILSPLTHRQRDEFIKLLDGADVFVSSSGMDSNPRLEVIWKNGKTHVAREIYEIYVPPDIRPWTGVLAKRPLPNLIPNSNLSYRRIKNWLGDCNSNHAKCASRPKDFMPSRVLYISGTAEEPTIRLSTDHPTVPYVTLSYCWGADQPAKTTRANFSSYLSNIAFSTLPATIRDAAIVTLRIGLSYLWVDAMCIIQDDQEDVMVQIAQMHAIYHSSWVTIAAAEAMTCNDGFLQPRGEWQPIRMRARWDEDGPSEVLLVPEGTSYREDAPLFRRGWTMQETSLSRSLLIYGQRELVFLCLEGDRCEGGDPLNARDGVMSFDLGDATYLQRRHPISWGYFVSRYSQRLLLVEGDKLLGIAALAEAYGRSKGVSGYVAGMWREDFLEQCLWTTEENPIEGSHGVARRPRTYRAPSWSWASLDGHISSFGESANKPLVVMPDKMPANVTCQVIDVRTTLIAAGNPFGMVSDGYLVIKGRLRQVVWDSPRWHGHLVKGPSVVTDTRMEFRMDCLKDWERTGDILLWSLEIGKADTGRGYALLLQEAGGREGLYRRVGRLDISKGRGWVEGWFESEYEFREITII